MIKDIAPKMLIFLYNVILPLIIGYIIKKITKIDNKKLDILIKLNIALFLPLSVTLTFWNMSFSSEMIYLPIIGLIMPLVGGGLGYLFSKNRYDNRRKTGSYIISSMLSNRKNIGGLSIYIIFGEIGYLYANMIMLFNAVTTYIIAHPLGNYFGNLNIKKNKVNFKSIVFRITNIGILAIIFGITLKLSGIVRPSFISDVVDKLIKISAWAALLPIGASIELSSIIKYRKDIPSLFLIKFVIMPLIAGVIAFLLFDDIIIISTVIMLAISPVAINAVVVAKMNNLDEHVSINAFLATSIFFIIIIFPLVLLALQFFIL